jgi:AcrR family transcriptional regulator
MSGSLPVFGQARPERADAAANRRKLLAAAEELFARHGPANVTMDQLAAAAGVGKGTLFRRFGDRAGVARAIVSEFEAELQDALIRGAPPLGPGAPPRERLLAFSATYLTFLERHAELLQVAEGSYEHHLNSSPYDVYRTHVALLLRAGGLTDSADYLADIVLAPLAAIAFAYHRGSRGFSLSELQTAHADLCARLLDSSK